MTTDYKYMQKAGLDKEKPAQKKTPLTPWASFIGGLAIGLCIAISIYFVTVYEQSATKQNSLHTQNAQSTETPAQSKQVVAEMPDKNAPNNPPEPEFNFYQILPNKQINVSEWITTQTPKHKDNIVIKPGSSSVYILQLGSFKDLSLAIHMKNKVAALGIEAQIQQVVINGDEIQHRVRIGPFTDLAKLQNLQAALHNNKIDAILLHLKNTN